MASYLAGAVPGLLAESRAAMARAETAEAALRGGAAARMLPGPRKPDPLVFGDWSPRTDVAPHPGPHRICPDHPGIGWHGTEPCWVCEATIQSTEGGTYAEVHPLSQA